MRQIGKIQPFFQISVVLAIVFTLINGLLFLMRPVASAEQLNDGWLPTAALPDATAGARALFNDSTLFVLGGSKNGSASPQVLRAMVETNGSVNDLLPVNASLPVSVYLHAAVIYKQGLYVIGGWNGARRYSDIRRAALTDLEEKRTDVWRSEIPYPRKIVLHEALVVGNSIYVLGGVDENNTPLNEVFFTKIDDTGALIGWQLTKPMPKALFRHAVLVDSNYIYVTGGYDGKQASDKIYYAPVNEQGSIQEWLTATLKLPKPLFYHQALIRAGKLWIIGGKNDDAEFNSVVSTPIESSHALEGLWSPEVMLPVSLYRFAALTLWHCSTHFVFIIGGLHENTYQSQIYRVGNSSSNFCYYLPWAPVMP